MQKRKRKLQLQQLEQKLSAYTSVKKAVLPDTGWLQALRLSLGMTLQQFANRLSITKQSARELELREMEGRITLKRLQEAANALDMELVYGLVPKDGSIENLIERKARELATRIVSQASTTMRLEDQENSTQCLERAVEERAAEYKTSLPKILWD